MSLTNTIFTKHPLLKQCGNIYKSSLVSMQAKTMSDMPEFETEKSYSRGEFLDGEIVVEETVNLKDKDKVSMKLYPIKERRCDDTSYRVLSIKDSDHHGCKVTIRVEITRTWTTTEIYTPKPEPPKKQYNWSAPWLPKPDRSIVKAKVIEEEPTTLEIKHSESRIIQRTFKRSDFAALRVKTNRY